jgi:hypothetical protein
VSGLQLRPVRCAGAVYYTLVAADGSLLAQGSWALCEATRLSRIYRDLPRQQQARLTFYGVLRRRTHGS